MQGSIIIWHVEPLLANDREISNYTTAVTRQQPVNSNRGTVLSVRSVPGCYKKDELIGELVSYIKDCCSSVVVSCCCEKLLSETRDSSGTQRKGNVQLWKPIPSNGSADVTVDTSMCVCVCVCV
jgi:hypothetical protein